MPTLTRWPMNFDTTIWRHHRSCDVYWQHESGMTMKGMNENKGANIIEFIFLHLMSVFSKNEKTLGNYLPMILLSVKIFSLGITENTLQIFIVATYIAPQNNWHHELNMNLATGTTLCYWACYLFHLYVVPGKHFFKIFQYFWTVRFGNITLFKKW